MDTIQLVTFRLDESLFGIDIMKVREIMGLAAITKLPASAPFLRGVINVRGKIVPVIDTRMKLGMTFQESSEESRLLLVEKGGNVAGLLVDEVSEVLTVDREQIETADDIGTGVGYSSGIVGVAKLDGRLLTLLDTDVLL